VASHGSPLKVTVEVAFPLRSGNPLAEPAHVSVNACGATRFFNKESTVPMVPSDSGFLLLDAEFNLIASNDPALQILCFPSEASRIKQPKVLLADRVRIALLDHRHRDKKVFVREIQSGKRCYICKTFQVNYSNGHSTPQPAFAVLLERVAAGGMTPAELTERFALTQRECETVEYLLQGLTSKEIAVRMKISPNTVKAFLRLVMVKMRVSSRSGIAGKVAGSRQVN
jgi:DNA-binding CsgD family transcriptional regulator